MELAVCGKMLWTGKPNTLSNVSSIDTILAATRGSISYCLSAKSRPNLNSNLVYEMGQDFLDRQYYLPWFFYYIVAQKTFRKCIGKLVFSKEHSNLITGPTVKQMPCRDPGRMIRQKVQNRGISDTHCMYRNRCLKLTFNFK